MGRYSTVQAYADNNTGVRKVPYEQAAAAASSSSGDNKQQAAAAPRPEKVVNPYGSTAGAGSGEFHVYRHARNREMQRQKLMELSAAEQEAEEKFRQEMEANQQWEEERTAKRRRKRERQKNAKKRKQNLAKAGILDTTDGGGNAAAASVNEDERSDRDAKTRQRDGANGTQRQQVLLADAERHERDHCDRHERFRARHVVTTRRHGQRGKGIGQDHAVREAGQRRLDHDCGGDGGC